MNNGLLSIFKSHRSELRLAARCLAILLAATILVTWLLAIREQIDQKAELQDRLGRILKGRSPVLATEIETHRNDILFLAATPPVKALLDETGDDPSDLDRLKTIFSAFLDYHPDVAELRLIGAPAGGGELIRVERLATGEIRAAPDGMLQPRSERDYIAATAALPPGRFYVSDISLSQDSHQPVLRFSTPLYRANGDLFGMIVSNIDAKPLLSKLGANIADGFSVYLANSRGDFALHSSPDRVFAADHGDHWNFSDEFPEFLQHGVQDGEAAEHQYGDGFSQARYQRIPIPGDGNRSFILAVTADNGLITAAVRSSVISNLPIFLVVDLLLASLTVWYFNQRRAKDLETVNRELAHRTEEAEAATRAKSVFLANMSHELRTPLNAIIGLGHLLADGELPARERDYVKKLSQAGESLLSLINDILDFSKIEAGRLVLEEATVSLEELARKVSMLIEPIRSSAVEAILDIDPRVPAEIIGDPLRLTQILLNLAGNAAKFTKSGEIVLSIDLVAETEQTAKLRFSVKDTGIGIAPHHVATLFQVFTQAENSTSRRYGGTGLGLAISSRLVDLMGGVLKCESEPGNGSLFWFVIEAAKAQSTTSIGQIAPPSMAGLRICIADNNATIRETAARICRSFGWEAVTSASGSKCLKLLEKDSRFDALVVDFDLSGPQGFDLLKMAAAAPLLRLPPVIILVPALQMDKAKQASAGLAVSAFLAKPFTPSSFHDTVLSLRHEERSAAAGKSALVSSLAGRLPAFSLLLVEDNPVNQLVAQALLTRAGAKVVVAPDGMAAIEELRAAPDKFDAVLMDVQMPGLDGYETTAAIRDELHLADLPIIAMTANALPEDRDKSLNAGMQGHVTKPIDVQELFAVLTSCITKGAAAGEEGSVSRKSR